MAACLVLTCEHGGKRIPAPYRSLFRGREALLNTHQGYDAGALALARFLSKSLKARLHAATTSRLLIDLNRSLGHPGLYSECSRAATAAQRRDIVERYYLPHRSAAERDIARAIARGRVVVHVACHSFTPELAGKVRTADVGLLYDPAHAGEAAFCARWKAALAAVAPTLKVRRNYPYLGKSDGFTAYLRKRFPAARYTGIELEVNQSQVIAGGAPWRSLQKALERSLASALHDRADA